MANEFTCPHCGKNLGYPTEPPGTELMCPYCQESFHFPAGSGSSVPTSNEPTVPDLLLSEPPTPEPDAPEPIKTEPAASEPAIPETVLTGPESADDLSTESPAPVSRPAYSKKTTPPPPKTVPRSTSTPYIIPELPRSSSATAEGYLGIFSSALGLVAAAGMALFLLWPNLKPELTDFIQSSINELGNPYSFLGGIKIAAILGGLSSVGLVTGIGLLKEKRWARIVSWLLVILVFLILLAVGGHIAYHYIWEFFKTRFSAGQPDPNIVTMINLPL